MTIADIPVALSGDRKGPSLRPDSFVTEMQMVSAMTMEVAYEWGKAKNRGEEDWARYGVGVQTPGLLGALEEAASRVGAASLASYTKHISWHWLAKCQSDPVISTPAKYYAKVRTRVVSSIHTDLDAKIKSADRYCFAEAENLAGKGFLYLPSGVFSALAQYASGAGIPPTDFFLIGLGWSLSTSKSKPFRTRAGKYYLPEYERLCALLKARQNQFMETLLVLTYRELCEKGMAEPLILNDTVVSWWEDDDSERGT